MVDVILTQKIPGDKVAILAPWFLAERPIPQIEDPRNPDEMIDEYTLKEWVNICQLENIRLICRRGKQRLHLAAQDPFDNSIVTNTS